MVYCFLKVETWSDELREKHNFFLEILRLAEPPGVAIAFPTQTIHVDSLHSQQPRQIGKKLADSEMARIVNDFGPNGKQSRPHGPVLTYNGKRLDFKTNIPVSRGEGE